MSYSWSSFRAAAIVAAACVVFSPSLHARQTPAGQIPALPPPEEQLRPTSHAVLPQDVEDFWFAPADRDRAAARNTGDLGAAAASYVAGNYAAALTSAERAVTAGGPLADYAQYYVGLSHLRLARAAEAEAAFDRLLAASPTGALSNAALIGKAEAAELRGNQAAAADIYDKLSTHKTLPLEDVLSRLGRAALAAGDRKRAAEAFARVYYEFPLSDAATTAGASLTALQDQVARTGSKLDLGRALILFGAKRYQEARGAFLDLQNQVSGDDREVTDLRIAECDYFLKRYAAARDGVQPYLDKASRKAEARYFYLSAVGEIGDRDRYVELTRQLVNDFPDSTWSEDALNSLGTYYILANQDEQAAQVFRETYERFPKGRHAERAAWKYGWWSYKTANYAETARVFESAAAGFPRSDYRPSYLYWSARARGRMGDRVNADARMQLVYTDYRNSYYGRLARKQLGVQRAAQVGGSADDEVVPASSRDAQPPAAELPPTAPLIRSLLAAGLYDDGLNELRYAQKAWGTSPAIEATVAWVYHQKGDLRRAITLMRRAYPQHLAAGGEGLPADVLQIIFPLTYWDQIRRNAAAHDLDPYLVAALIAQESTFDPGAHSPANAWGLMQLVPATGRRLAQSVGIRRFNVTTLTNADVNIRLGTLYFSRLVQQFGGTYYALASYNAGESRVVRWKSERPGLEEDEFIDDIPFPETQNYVKRILGTAEDYRRLYSSDGARPSAPRVRAASTASLAAGKGTTRSSASTLNKKTTTKKPVVSKKKPTARKKAPARKRR